MKGKPANIDNRLYKIDELNDVKVNPNKINENDEEQEQSKFILKNIYYQN